jgi:hypothetical protein
LVILQTLSTLAVRELIDAGYRAVSLPELNTEAGPVVEAVLQRFTEPRRRS